MATIKKYIKPSITTIFINRTNILCSSRTDKYDKANICSEFCKIWHICRDRAYGNYCLFASGLCGATARIIKLVKED